jgi:Cu+-exporting ATPase
MKEPPGTPSFRDPVCGMQVRENAPHRHEHAGRTYRFCSAGCLAKFRADPARYPDKPEATSRSTNNS